MNVPVAMTYIAMWIDIPDPEKIMQKYERAVAALDEGKEHTMKVIGNSMLPIITSGSSLTFRKDSTYEIDDVVLTKVKGRWFDAHKITKIDTKGRYLISNNKGWDNGWTRKVYGRVIAINGEPFGRRIIHEDDTAQPKS